MYIAKRPIQFENTRYLVGQEIPEEVITPTRIKDLIKMNLIEEVSKPEKISRTGIQKEKVIKKIYSAQKLESLKKEELIKIAQENNIATEGLTVKELINAIKESNKNI